MIRYCNYHYQFLSKHSTTIYLNLEKIDFFEKIVKIKNEILESYRKQRDNIGDLLYFKDQIK